MIFLQFDFILAYYAFFSTNDNEDLLRFLTHNSKINSRFEVLQISLISKLERKQPKQILKNVNMDAKIHD